MPSTSLLAWGHHGVHLRSSLPEATLIHCFLQRANSSSSSWQSELLLSTHRYVHALSALHDKQDDSCVLHGPGVACGAYHVFSQLDDGRVLGFDLGAENPGMQTCQFTQLGRCI